MKDLLTLKRPRLLSCLKLDPGPPLNTPVAVVTHLRAVWSAGAGVFGSARPSVARRRSFSRRFCPRRSLFVFVFVVLFLNRWGRQKRRRRSANITDMFSAASAAEAAPSVSPGLDPGMNAGAIKPRLVAPEAPGGKTQSGFDPAHLQTGARLPATPDKSGLDLTSASSR